MKKQAPMKIFLASCSDQVQFSGVKRASFTSRVIDASNCNRIPYASAALAFASVVLLACGTAHGAIRYSGLGETNMSGAPVVTAGSTDSESVDNVPTVVAPSAVQHSPLNTTGYAAWKTPVPTVSQEGYGTASRNTSFGNGLPVKSALEMILPEGWRIYAKPGVDGSAPVTWKSNNDRWTIPLTTVLRQSGLNAVVNWPHQALLLSVRPIHKSPALDTTGYTAWHKSGNSSLPANFHVGNAVQSTIPLQGVSPIFLLNQGDLILTDLQKWAKQSGWAVVWQIPEDWSVPNTTAFNGSFKSAVTQVVRALAANGANIHAVFHPAINPASKSVVVISGAGGGE